MKNVVDVNSIPDKTGDAVRNPLFVGGRSPADLRDQIARGIHPRVEYLLLSDEYQIELIGRDEATRRLEDAGKFQQKAGVWFDRERLNWAFAALLPWNGKAANAETTIIATGEDVGLPVALRLRFHQGGNANKKRQRPSLCIITHGSYLNSPKFRWIARVMGSAQHIRWLCLSESIRALMVDEFHFAPSVVENAGYGVDTTFFAPQPEVVVQTHQVASAGMANRDYKTLSAAVATKEMQDVSVKIAADSAWYQSALDIDGSTLPANVEARSYGDYVGLRRLYAESSFIVVPLYQARNACGYAVISEAMAMGKPVIATGIKACSDYVVEGETGFHTPPGDVAALRERIRYLVDHPEVAKEMGRKARRHIEDNFTLEQHAARIAAASGIAKRGEAS